MKLLNPQSQSTARLLPLCLAVFCLLISLTSGMPALAAEKTDGVRVLVVTGMDHPAHDWRKTTPVLKEELEKDSRLKVDIMEDFYKLEDADLSRYQVVFLHFNNMDKPEPGDAAKTNLQSYVSGGGGLFILHFACGAFSKWPEYAALAGRVWDRKTGHDRRGPFQVNILNTNHPVTSGLASFEADDELYICLTGDKPVELLANARSKITHKDHPMAFTHTYGQGRVFHTPLGHDVRAIQVPGTAELIRRGCAWAAGLPPASP